MNKYPQKQLMFVRSILNYIFKSTKMKKGIMLLMAAIAFVALSFTNPIEIEILKTNVSKSEIKWTGYKVTGKHFGTVEVKEGALDFSEGMLTGGSFVIDMNSIAVKDIEGEWAGKLEGHLKSEDFFGVEKHPTATFTITQVAAKGTPGDYKVIGNVTIKEKTEEVKFYAHVEETAEGKVATADIKLDRTDFDVKYGSGSFFSGLGDKTIYDEFDLEVKLVLDNNN